MQGIGKEFLKAGEKEGNTFLPSRFPDSFLLTDVRLCPDSVPESGKVAALRHNLNVVRRVMPDHGLMAIVKAEGPTGTDWKG